MAFFLLFCATFAEIWILALSTEMGSRNHPVKRFTKERKYYMQPKRSLIYILAVLVTLPLFGTVASATTIDVFQTFDFPGEGCSTLPQKISDQTDLIGTRIDAVNGNVKAFVYKVKKQKFSPAFNAPFDTGHVTNGRGINNKRHTCGEYLNGSDSTSHGFLMVSGLKNELILYSVRSHRRLGYDSIGNQQFRRSCWYCHFQ